MEKVDIKYLGIPNVCFSLVDTDDNREPNYKEQRIARGFDDSETWSLRDTIANFIIPRLELYQEITKDFIEIQDPLMEDIDSFLLSMKLVARDNGAAIFTAEEQLQVDKGLNAFPKMFMTLWW